MNTYKVTLTLEVEASSVEEAKAFFIQDVNELQTKAGMFVTQIDGEKAEALNTPQELRNAVYTGEWLTDAKRYFSKKGCAAYRKSQKYMNAKVERQEYLEKAIKWISHKKGCQIEDYMAQRQHSKNANELWTYFQNVISWIEITFPDYRKEMKGLDWGILYNKYSDNEYDTDYLGDEVKRLIQDDDVTKKSGIYEYLLSGNEKHLNIRSFSDNMKREAYERQDGICPHCGNHFDIDKMEADHIIPWSKGGRTSADNCQILCQPCNRKKGGK